MTVRSAPARPKATIADPGPRARPAAALPLWPKRVEYRAPRPFTLRRSSRARAGVEPRRQARRRPGTTPGAARGDAPDLTHIILERGPGRAAASIRPVPPQRARARDAGTAPAAAEVTRRRWAPGRSRRASAAAGMECGPAGSAVRPVWEEWQQAPRGTRRARHRPRRQCALDALQLAHQHAESDQNKSADGGNNARRDGGDTFLGDAHCHEGKTCGTGQRTQYQQK